MSLILDGRLAIIDKDVTQAFSNLELPSPTEEVPKNEEYREAIAAFVATAMRKPEVKSISEDCGLTSDKITYIYSVGITSLHPNPLIMAGNTLLAASLIFMEPNRLRLLADQINLIQEAGPHHLEWRTVAANVTRSSVKAIKQAHDLARGEAVMPEPGKPVRRQTTGCLLALVLLPIGALIGTHASQ